MRLDPIPTKDDKVMYRGRSYYVVTAAHEPGASEPDGKRYGLANYRGGPVTVLAKEAELDMPPGLNPQKE